MNFNIKEIAAILYQFVILVILTWALIKGVEVETVVGALIGLAVGIGINTVKE